MHQHLDDLTARFEESLLILSRNLGPDLIKRTQSDLTPGQVFMLYFISQNSQCSVSKLAENMEVAPSAITVMVDRLEDHGFVRRFRDKADRRVVITELTSAGQKKLNQVLAVRNQITRHCLAHLDANKVESFIEVLESLASVAQEMDAEEVVGLSKDGE